MYQVKFLLLQTRSSTAQRSLCRHPRPGLFAILDAERKGSRSCRREIKPQLFSSLKHFTVPWAMPLRPHFSSGANRSKLRLGLYGDARSTSALFQLRAWVLVPKVRRVKPWSTGPIREAGIQKRRAVRIDFDGACFL